VFLASQVELAPAEAMQAVRQIISRSSRPAMSEAFLLDKYRDSDLNQTADGLAKLLG
jgi:hypothetical protein